MKRLLKWLPSRRWLFIPPILIGVGTFVFFATSKKELSRVDAGEMAVSVQVVSVKREAMQPEVVGYGTVEPSRVWTAVAEVNGRIVDTRPRLDSGVQVKMNEWLVKIDDSDYLLRQDQRQADLDAANAKVAELKASKRADEQSLKIEIDLMEVNQGDLERMERLFGNNAVSETEYEQARQTVLRQRQAIQKLENSISLYPSKIDSATASAKMAKARLAEADRDVARTKISSPLRGTLADAKLEVGQVVGVGERLFEIQDDRKVEIEAQFSLAQIRQLFPESRGANYETSTHTNLNNEVDMVRDFDAQLLDVVTAKVVVRSGDVTHRWCGKPIRISDSVNQQTRTLGVVIQVENQPELDSVLAESMHSNSGKVKVSSPQDKAVAPLRVGTFCEVILLGAVQENALPVPLSALDEQDVFIVDHENRLRRKKVKTGLIVGDRIAIISGLQSGDRVATLPPVPAIEGMLTSPRSIHSKSEPTQRVNVSLDEDQPRQSR